jgi:transcriptional regulator with XRE-family HTH domain
MSTVITKDQARRNLSTNLQYLLRARKLRQADVVKAIRAEGEETQNVRQRVYRYVHGMSDVVGDDLANIAEFFSVSTDYLLSARRQKNSRQAG